MTAARCLGKRAPKNDPRTLAIGDFLTRALLPAPPPARDWTSKAAPDFGMMRNDEIGDCTIAAVAHQIQIWTSQNGAELTPSDGAVVAAYSDLTGYTPTDPTTDLGAIEIDVLNKWRSEGLLGNKLGAYCKIDPKNRMHVEIAINMLGGLYVGAALPLAAQSQTVWDIAPPGAHNADYEPGSWGGHAMIVAGFSRLGVELITWGAVKVATWEFFRTYVDEAYGLLDDDWVSGDKPAPSGFDIDRLRAALRAL